MKNQPFDLAVDIDESNNNSIATNEQEEDRDDATTLMGKKNMDSDFKNSTFERKQHMDGDNDQEDENNAYIPGQYNPKDYDNLEVNDEIKDLFK